MTKPKQPRKPIPWDETNDQKWTDAAFVMMQNGALEAQIREPGGVATLVVAGRCPRCDCKYSSRQPLEAVTSTTGRLDEEGLTHDVAVRAEATFCECQTSHPGRPEGRMGCGVCFTVLASVPT